MGTMLFSAKVVPPYRLWYGGSGWCAHHREPWVIEWFKTTWEQGPSAIPQLLSKSFRWNLVDVVRFLAMLKSASVFWCGSIFESSILRFGRLDSMKLRVQGEFPFRVSYIMCSTWLLTKTLGHFRCFGWGWVLPPNMGTRWQWYKYYIICILYKYIYIYQKRPVGFPPNRFPNFAGWFTFCRWPLILSDAFSAPRCVYAEGVDLAKLTAQQRSLWGAPNLSPLWSWSLPGKNSREWLWVFDSLRRFKETSHPSFYLQLGSKMSFSSWRVLLV